MKQFLVGKHVNSTVKNIYLSDHDVLKIHIQKENREEIDGDLDISISYCSSCLDYLRVLAFKLIKGFIEVNKRIIEVI